jgi:hypothetical protein
MEINLNRDSFVDQRTGQVDTPSEFLENLRAIEADLARADDDIATLKSDLKAARDARETLVTRLRAAVRDGKVLPLLEVAEQDDGLFNVDPEED